MRLLVYTLMLLLSFSICFIFWLLLLRRLQPGEPLVDLVGKEVEFCSRQFCTQLNPFTVSVMSINRWVHRKKNHFIFWENKNVFLKQPHRNRITIPGIKLFLFQGILGWCLLSMQGRLLLQWFPSRRSSQSSAAACLQGENSVKRNRVPHLILQTENENCWRESKFLFWPFCSQRSARQQHQPV